MEVERLMRAASPGACSRCTCATLTLSCAFLLVGCGPPTTTDLDPPRVVEVLPAGPIIETSATFTVRFSEPIAAQRVLDGVDMVALAPANFVDNAFLTDIGRPPLIESRRARTLPSTIGFSEDRLTLTVTPNTAMTAGTRYALVISSDVRDTSGNPLVGPTGEKANFVHEVRTDAGPPVATASSAVGTVPLNLKRIRVSFNQPMNGFSTDAIRVDGTGVGAPAITALEVAPDRMSATLVLADSTEGGCARLAPLANYVVVVAGDLTDDVGRIVQPRTFPFEASGACDLTPNRIVGAVTSYGIAPTGYVFFVTSKASTTEVRFGREGFDLDCLGTTCPSVGEDSRTAATNGFSHSATFIGVIDGDTYDVLVRAEDDMGNVALGTTSLVVTPRPTVAINEILQNPVGPEEAGEFIEIANYGPETVSLAGFTLQIADRVPCGLGVDPILDLAPGAYLVVARSTYVPSTYPEGDETRVYNPPGCGATQLLLANEVVSVALFDDLGRPVSVYAGYPTLSPAPAAREGKSIERIAPDAPDREESFCFSTGAPSPGRENSVLALGCP
jgi:hypothetical protein